MPDRFKFRAWDKKNKQMHYDDFIITSNGQMKKPQPASLEMAEIAENLDELGYRYMLFDQAENNEDDIVLMQSTGLKDKNGKLIYEGDIVARNSDKALIKWDDEIASFYMKWESTETFIEDCEVIGNIYENPELLEGVQCE